MPMKVVAIIPARYASSRFPGKPLIKLDGMTMIERTYKQAKKSRLVSEVIVATDDERIAEAVKAFGGMVEMTDSQHPTGTDRLAEVVKRHPEIDIIANVQGDEPLIEPAAIDAVIEPLLADPSIGMATLAAPLTQTAEIESPSVVKVVKALNNKALYFSRFPIPFYRQGSSNLSAYQGHKVLGHSGMYVYRRDILLKLATLLPSPLEIAESLEQLRALENGIDIFVVEDAYRPVAVDSPADVEKIEALLSRL
jgi:3-deoxy-manno-octulosonate cytidylyltransferase (CMP-KDO synthetase)